MKLRFVWVVALVALVVAALACESGGGSLVYSDFEKVCNGEGVEETAYYGESDGPFPVRAFVRSGPDKGYVHTKSLGESFPDEWFPENPNDTELVVCLTITDRQLAQECLYAEDENATEADFTVNLYDTKYEAVLHNAETGEELSTTEFYAKNDRVCDDFVTLREDSEEVSRDVDADPGSALVSFLEPWVLP